MTSPIHCRKDARLRGSAQMVVILFFQKKNKAHFSCWGIDGSLERTTSTVVPITQPIKTQPKAQGLPVGPAKSVDNEDGFTPRDEIVFTVEQAAHLKDLDSKWTAKNN
ncbi:hypothetical protein PRIPAC_95145 [Pristionchus pacificus]|uniref:Uncharacterized protein n=1 Tax=Pristionchus pacificus TaxID=54126 RepID=A0A2A6BDB4_PRIPA|nr:hypothetical protein PRIPAC_95145 [Pristionchus pacificus]|eukprot:PDM63836.1 hypothetical protein PRIPAC_49809 [Pristionchus pacificus]